MRPRPILFLKSNPWHGWRGRFAHGAADGAGAGAAPIVQCDPAIIGGTDRATARDAAREYAKEHFRGDANSQGIYTGIAVRNVATGHTITIAPQGVDKATTHGSLPGISSERDLDHFRMIPALPRLLEAATPYGAAASDRKARPEIRSVYSLAAHLQIGGQQYRVRMVIREHADGRRFYDHYLTDIENVEDAPGEYPLLRKAGDQERLGYPPGAWLDVILLRALFNDDLLAKALPPGARWITVRPNGPGTEGSAVMIQPSGDGAFRVIGGAGGKLNYLKLTGVRSEAEYASRAKDKAAAGRDEKKRQQTRDRQAGLVGVKSAAKEQLRLSDRQARNDFIAQVSAALKWEPDATCFKHEDHQNLPQSELDKLEAQHFDKLYTAAETAVDTQRQHLLADADMRADAGLAGVPLSSPEHPEQLSVADLDPVESDGTATPPCSRPRCGRSPPWCPSPRRSRNAGQARIAGWVTPRRCQLSI